MKKLNELYEGYPEIDIKDIKINSKDIVPGDLFVCIKGITKNRKEFIPDAIKKGVSAIVTDEKMNLNIPVIVVENPHKELVRLSQMFYDFKQDDFTIIATTGTNGKTTVASIIKDMIGDSSAYIGTNGYRFKNKNEDIVNTTPSPDRLYKYFKLFKSNNCNIVTMEASSEAFLRNRLDNLKFDIGILTNVTTDHINAHKTLKNYINCKKELFKNVKDNGYSILNSDDLYFNDFLSIAKGNILTYGKNKSTLQIIDFKENINNTLITLKYKNKLYHIDSPLLGEYNIYNLCCAILSLIALNYDINDIIKRIKLIQIPKGRFEVLDFQQNYKIILDYAHNEDAFLKIFNFINKIKKRKVITITGSAGERDKEKRPIMGRIALDNSDLVIFTMDDPRDEEVDDIINDLIKDSTKTNYIKIIDRVTAINYALSIAEKDDYVLILGKGRDNYMAIKDKYIPYNDYDIIKEYFTK